MRRLSKRELINLTFNFRGNQEALTFYHTNGSNVDLSAIPAPLLTNVTAQSMVQVAPKPETANGDKSQTSWSALKDLASLPKTSPGIKSGKQLTCC